MIQVDTLAECSLDTWTVLDVRVWVDINCTNMQIRQEQAKMFGHISEELDGLVDEVDEVEEKDAD
jgi:hypothetical protein